MFSITLSITESKTIIDIINKEHNHFLVHQFNPTYSYDWMKTTVKNEIISLDNISIRKMSFDILCDLKTIEKITQSHTHYLNIYQFNKTVSNSLVIENLNTNTIDKILLQNGLEYKYFINNEYLTVYSFDKEFITKIEKHPVLKNLIIN